MNRKMNGEGAKPGKNTSKTTDWSVVRSKYVCKDGVQIEVPIRTADTRDPKKQTALPSSGVIYARDA